MGNDCPRVFLEAPSCLTHSFSHRGPMCVVASSGLAHDGNTKETDWKWNTFLRIKEGFLEFGTFAVSDCLCPDVFRSGAEAHSLRAIFVVFGWVSVLYLPSPWYAICSGLTLTLLYMLRQWSALEVTPAIWTAPTEEPCRHHDASSTSQAKQSKRRGSSGSHCGLRQRPFLSLRRLVDLTNMAWMPMMTTEYWIENITIYGRSAVVVAGKGRVSMWCVCKIKFFPPKTAHVLPFFDCTWCCRG